MLVLIYIWNISTCLCWERKPFNTPINWDRFQERYIVILPRTCLVLIYIWNISTCLCWERKPFNTPINWDRDILLSCLGHAWADLYMFSTCLCWESKPFNTPINWDRFQERYIVILPRTCWCWFIYEILAHACAGKENHSIHSTNKLRQISREIYCFIICKVMKYRKILIKYNAYLKRSCISQLWKYKKLYFHCSENISCISRVKLDVLCFVHWLSLAHFRISNACNFLISGQKHKVWVFIFLVRSQGIFWWLNCRDLQKFSLSLLLLLWFQFWPTCYICNVIINMT